MEFEAVPFVVMFPLVLVFVVEFVLELFLGAGAGLGGLAVVIFDVEFVVFDVVVFQNKERFSYLKMTPS